MRELRLDCRYFIGEKPCKMNSETNCKGCVHYSSMGTRILIIKLAAIGDVLRTTTILPALKEKYELSYITWLTDAQASVLLNNNPYIDRLLIYNENSTFISLLAEEFDLLLCFDKEKRATALASLIKAKEKRGFGLSKYGTIYPLNSESEYAFELGINNKLKFYINEKTYPEIIHEIASLPYIKERAEYVFSLPSDVKEKIKKKAENWGILSDRDTLVIGLNTGCGSIFASKKWSIEGFLRLAELLYLDYSSTENKKIKLLLLGGPEEKERNKSILEKSKVPLIDTGCDNSLLEFCGIIDLCDLIISSDTLAMHIAIALKKLVVAIFGPTCAQEIELYGRGEKVIANAPCAPCYLQNCKYEQSCLDKLPAEQVYKAVKKTLSFFQKI